VSILVPFTQCLLLLLLLLLIWTLGVSPTVCSSWLLLLLLL
jgi:hypothetical protein